MTTQPPSPSPVRVRTFLLTVFPDATRPPIVKEIFNPSHIDQNMPPGVRQFIINMPTIPGSVTTIKEIY